MASLKQLSIKSRLMGLVLGVSFGALLIAGILSWLQFRRAFQAQMFDHLISVRASKGKQIEHYLTKLQSHIAILSEDQMVVSAMVDMNGAYRQLQNEAIANDWLKAIDRYYSDEFLAELAENVQATQVVANYRPTSQSGQYLQYQYLIKNATAEKSEVNDAGDGSSYSTTHARYHPIFKNLVDEFGYGDLYLINNNGNAVYSVQKESDYATSLERGPYRRSNLAEVVDAVRNDPGRGFVKVADYKPYVPAYSAPTAFLAAPIYNGPHILGTLAVQFPTQDLEILLSGNQEWEQDGLGKTGQIYIVGPDLLMRSSDRTLIEKPEAYQTRLKRIGLSPQTLNLIETLQTSILLHPIDTTATKEALAGTINTQIINDYRGVSVLSSYAPLRLKGLRWIILAEIEQSEAFSPVTRLQIYMSILGVILILLIAWLTNIAAQNFANPVQTLLDAMTKVRQGERDVDIEIGDDSKSDELEIALQEFVQDLRTQEELVAEKSETNQALLNNLMPSSMVARMDHREPDRPLASSHQQVTLLVVRITGLRPLTLSQDPEAIAHLSDYLMRTFEQKARTYGLDTHLTLDDTYIATCGVSRIFLDHQERGVNFALDLVKFVETERDNLPDTIDLQVGIHSGPVMAGVVGGEKFMYKLWGDSLTIAMALNPVGGATNSILVTQPIYERIKERYLLVANPTLRLDDVGLIPRWMVFTRTAQFDAQVEQVQTSFGQLLPDIRTTAQFFYRYLFEHDSELTSIMVGSVFQDESPEQQARQQKQFAEVLQTVVKGMGTVDKLVPTLQEWGHKYAKYELEEHHYDTLGAALLRALEQTLGSDFTPEVKHAWAFVYDFFKGVIEEAAMVSNGPARILVDKPPSSPVSASMEAENALPDGPPPT